MLVSQGARFLLGHQVDLGPLTKLGHRLGHLDRRTQARIAARLEVRLHQRFHLLEDMLPGWPIPRLAAKWPQLLLFLV